MFNWKQIILGAPAVDPAQDFREFDLPENRQFLKSCSPLGLTGNPFDPDFVTRGGYAIETHPDLVQYLWEEVASELPRSVRWLVLGTAVLVHPESKIIFACCGGTHRLMFRLPADSSGELEAKWVEARAYQPKATALANRAYEFASPQ